MKKPQETNQPTQDNLDYKEAYIRATADYQNLQKEMIKKQKEWQQYANAGLINELLPVISHFKQALTYIPEDQQEQDWVIGIKQIKKQLDEFMLGVGLEEIKTLKEQFNPELHEAVGQVDQKDQKSDTIVTEVQAGYKLKGKVLQPAKVIINN